MKKLENNFKKNSFNSLSIAVIALGMFSLLMACKTKNNDATTSQTDVDTLKSTNIQKVDTIAKLDTTKKVDINVKKP